MMQMWMFMLLAGEAVLHGAKAADCSDSNLQLKIDPGSWYEYCCTQRDGSQDVSYYAKFHSVNNDQYTTQSVVADDSGNTGHCAGSSGGPDEWKSYQMRYYSDNFDHEENFYDENSGGVYLTTQISFRVGCTTPGSGSQCQVNIDQLNQCSGSSCGPSAAVSLNRNGPISVVHNATGKGHGATMPLMVSKTPGKGEASKPKEFVVVTVPAKSTTKPEIVV